MRTVFVPKPIRRYTGACGVCLTVPDASLGRRTLPMALRATAAPRETRVSTRGARCSERLFVHGCS